MEDPVRLSVTAAIVHRFQNYLPGESTLVERELALEIAASHPDAGATWTEFSIEKAEEDARAALLETSTEVLP